MKAKSSHFDRFAQAIGRPTEAVVEKVRAEAEPDRRNVVVCCDGTGNEFGDRNTNVVKLYGLLVKDDRQVGYYDPGVGTFATPAALSGTAKRLSKLSGLAFATGITENIEDAYRFLMSTYEPGDRLFLFGFSRGAYTVRALAGMLKKCGLLERGAVNLVPYATKMYRYGGPRLAAAFFETYARPCRPHFIGVWDTVKSVGFFVPRQFPNAVLNQDVRHGRQALAIDEKRMMYKPIFWDTPAAPDGQCIRQLWFPGAHSNVGGGLARSNELSDGALEWMVEEAIEEKLRVIPNWRDSIRPVATGWRHRSLLPAWWVLPFLRRHGRLDIGLHSSVEQRRSAMPRYGPDVRTPPRWWEYVAGYSPTWLVLAAIGAGGGLAWAWLFETRVGLSAACGAGVAAAAGLLAFAFRRIMGAD